MDTHYGKKEDRSGVRLISLLGNHLKEILKRESDNRAFIHLYCTGSVLGGVREISLPVTPNIFPYLSDPVKPHHVPVSNRDGLLDRWRVTFLYT